MMAAQSDSIDKYLEGEQQVGQEDKFSLRLRFEAYLNLPKTTRVGEGKI